MTFWQFADSSPFAAFFIALLILSAFITSLNFMFRVINRLIRHWNISVRGWPPPHLDADGDFKVEEKDDDSKEEKEEDNDSRKFDA